MSSQTEKEISRDVSNLWLWIGLLAGPAAFFLNMQINYLLVPWACSTGNMLALHLVSLGALLAAAAGGLIAWRSWREAGREWPSETAGTIPRSRFMAALGFMISGLFLLVILAQWIPNFIVSPCQM